MSRLYLIAFFLLLCPSFFGQNNLGKYIKFADEQFAKGNYIYALSYYEKALELDSNSISILWKYAETQRAYKDYRKAEQLYKKVYDREGTSIYPESLLNWALMAKQNGHYEEALELFKKAKKIYSKRKKEYVYLKAKQEVESCTWAKSALKDTADLNYEKLPESVNTVNSEFSHGYFRNQLLYSSLRPDSTTQEEEVYAKHYKTKLYLSKHHRDTFDVGVPIPEFIHEQLNSGNGSFSLDSTRFYFSLCREESYNYRCKIMVAYFENNRWNRMDTLGDIINEAGANTTMPCIGNLEGQEVLFFASNRKDSEGGMDIFYSTIKNGQQYGKPKAIKGINSLDQEITPWWSPKEKRLYFSSSWWNGFGGTDIFYSVYQNGFTTPVNLGIPFNSPANDLYYFKQKDTSYFTSNRLGVYYAKNPTCCSDIFTTYEPIRIYPPEPKETLLELAKRLPVTLYFHNDCPDPKSKDTTTRVNYIKGYEEYRNMLEKYQFEYSAGLSGEKANDAKEDIESFFIEYVDQGVKDLYQFRTLLFEELEKGKQIKLTVKGFASPLAKTDYNVNLTKRRIQSLKNYLNEYEQGIFKPYLEGTAANGGKVIIVEVPFGEYTANKLTSDNFHDQKNSVYSRAAAIERKIEIQSVQFINDGEALPITSNPMVYDVGKTSKNFNFEKTFVVKNEGAKVVTINSIQTTDKVDITWDEQKEWLPGDEKKIQIKWNTNDYEGLSSIHLKVFLENYSEHLPLSVTFEVK